MRLPPNITPPSAAIADVLVRGGDDGWVTMDAGGMAAVKPLWANGESGEWAVLFRWKKGYAAPRHKHLGAIHVYVVSGSVRVRDTVLHAGDYMYEPNGQIHDETLALEDCVHLNIANGPIVLFDDNGIRAYISWEQIAAMRAASR